MSDLRRDRLPLTITLPHIRGALELVIYGQPEPQRRPRFARRGRGVATYAHPADAAYRERIQQAWRSAGAVDLGSADIGMTIWACFSRPKSHWRRNGELSKAGIGRPYPGVCDVDNIAKAILDALQGEHMAFRDDRQIVGLHVTKFYADRPDDEPYVQVHAQTIRNMRTVE